MTNNGDNRTSAIAASDGSDRLFADPRAELDRKLAMRDLRMDLRLAVLQAVIAFQAGTAIAFPSVLAFVNGYFARAQEKPSPEQIRCTLLELTLNPVLNQIGNDFWELT